MKRFFKSMTTLLACGFFATNAFAADIVETAVGAGNFKTLAAALGAADLVDTLKGPGPFTVFAPTDEAFAKIPAQTLQDLLKPENKGTLSGILTYHVVSGKVLAKDVVGLKGAVTVNGQRVDIKVADGKVSIDNATVVTTDIVCDNGVIHVIDSVILPADKTIPEVATAAESFKTLLAAVSAVGLAETLSGPGPFTVFAPTDEAFAKLPAGTVESLLKPENKQKLVDILKYHVVSGRVYSEAVVSGKPVKAIDGNPLAVNIGDEGVKINKSGLVATDVDASNGVIHIIDSVLLPPEKGADARKMIENAIAQGAPLYNAGHHDACAQIYHQAMSTLSHSMADPTLKQHVRSVVQTANGQHCPTERSWTLRHGMDYVYTRMSLAK